MQSRYAELKTRRHGPCEDTKSRDRCNKRQGRSCQALPPSIFLCTPLCCLVPSGPAMSVSVAWQPEERPMSHRDHPRSGRFDPKVPEAVMERRTTGGMQGTGPAGSTWGAEAAFSKWSYTNNYSTQLSKFLNKHHTILEVLLRTSTKGRKCSPRDPPTPIA
eukprot:765812-Hanusia_phi.AAC.1